MRDDAALLALATELAQRAGAAILEIRKRGFDVQRKEDRSPVTEADHAAEAIIAAGLRAAEPDIPVIAEEEVAGGRITQVSSCYWLVDPLDGTREFAAGNDEFAVNIGLVRDGIAVLGVVGIPAAGELFGGIVGQGAWKQTDRGTAPVSARLPPPEGLTVLASRYHGNSERLDSFLAGKRVARLVNFGSSVKFCRLAEGIADLYPRFGRTMEWDTCAPQAVLEAAGGTVSTFDGVRLGYGKPGWENPHFVCTGRPPAG
jgi:3'(2'), 5'-bisphosphate nucleotidase